ncbi:MAG: ABC transporter substrate-binding protein [Alphaproteobacteria bacterium]|nr:ABC transporter substrate-binding protein [Alphaproteobacteria bacterium]
MGLRLLTLLCLFATLSGSTSLNAVPETLPPKVPLKNVSIVITQYVSHAALDAVRDGAMDRLKDCTKDKFNIVFNLTNASANLLVARQIAQKHASEEPDVIIAISTLSAQSVLSAVRGRVPLIFGAITDPKAAQISGKNVTGVTDKPPFREQILFIQELVPSLKDLAVLYNPGEDNSRYAVAELREILRELDLNLVTVAVTKSTDLPQAVRKVTETAQAIFIANDNLIASSFESLIKITNSKKIPVFTSDIMLVERGAVGMRGIDYYNIGQQAGSQACQILEGIPLEDIPVSHPNSLKLYLNQEAATITGISFSKTLLKEADKVVKGPL